jgi:hypothetical protein
MSNPPTSSTSSSDKTNWEPLLRHSSPLGILKPGIVFDVYSSSGSTMSSSSMQSLPNPRVVRTTHTKDTGTSVFASDETLVPFSPFGPALSSFTTIDVRASVPVNNMDTPASAPPSIPRCTPGGVIFTVADYPGSGYEVPIHRTLSLDYGIVLFGEIVLVLDGGDEKTLRAGDFIVQQGVNHKWINRAEGVCRVVFVCISAEKVVLEDGTELEQTVIRR